MLNWQFYLKPILENFSIEAADNYYSIERGFSDFTKAFTT
jgi:hypothetical protein